MNDSEINEAVARKLGRVICHGKDGQWHTDKEPNGCGNSANYLIPNYCTGLKEAWEIVEKIKNTTLFELWWHDGEWECNINENEICEKHDTAPMAICLAFLKLP